MGDFTIFDKSTGEIWVWGSCHDGEEANQVIDPANDYIAGTAADRTLYYIAGYPSAPVVTPRPVLPYSFNKTSITDDGTDEATIGPGLPNPTYFTIDSTDPGVAQQTGTCTDGTAEITISTPGVFTVTVESFPYKNFVEYIGAGGYHPVRVKERGRTLNSLNLKTIERPATRAGARVLGSVVLNASSNVSISTKSRACTFHALATKDRPNIDVLARARALQAINATASILINNQTRVRTFDTCSINAGDKIEHYLLRRYRFFDNLDVDEIWP